MLLLRQLLLLARLELALLEPLLHLARVFLSLHLARVSQAKNALARALSQQAAARASVVHPQAAAPAAQLAAARGGGALAVARAAGALSAVADLCRKLRCFYGGRRLCYTGTFARTESKQRCLGCRLPRPPPTGRAPSLPPPRPPSPQPFFAFKKAWRACWRIRILSRDFWRRALGAQIKLYFQVSNNLACVPMGMQADSFCSINTCTHIVMEKFITPFLGTLRCSCLDCCASNALTGCNLRSKEY